MVSVWINQLLQGVMLGGLYTLFATGLSLSAGVLRFVNIAHGDFIVLACYVLLVLTTSLGLNPVVATLIILPFAFLLGFVLQRFLLQRVVGENADSNKLPANISACCSAKVCWFASRTSE